MTRALWITWQVFCRGFPIISSLFSGGGVESGRSYFFQQTTRPKKTKIASENENGASQNEMHLPTISIFLPSIFRCESVSFTEGIKSLNAFEKKRISKLQRGSRRRTCFFPRKRIYFCFSMLYGPEKRSWPSAIPDFLRQCAWQRWARWII